MKKISTVVPVFCIAVFFGVFLYTLYVSLKYNKLELIYATEDNYIHLAMAKNLSQHGHWSVDLKDFTSSSSSSLWLILLSATYVIFGVNKFSPLVLNTVFGLLTILSAYFLFIKYHVRNILIFLGLLAIIFFTPVIPLMFSGQEHTMHIFLVLMYVYFSVNLLVDKNPPGQTAFFILTPLLVMARYESLFLVFIVALLLLIRKKFFNAMLALILAVIPVIAYGLFSVSKGWYFIPNSILLKGQVPNFSTLEGILNFIGWAGIKQMTSTLPVLLLVIASVIMLISFLFRERTLWTKTNVLLFIFIAISFLHMQFARTGSFYRYEAYLVALGLVSLIVGINKLLSGRSFAEAIKSQPAATGMVIILIIAMLFPLSKRAYNSLLITPNATVNIFQQQYQMGLFLRQFYQGKSIAANDIGAINYLADVKCLDLAGLGSLEIASLMKDNKLSKEKIYELAKENDVKVAIVYDHWFQAYGGLPEQWKKVGEWTITHNVIVAGNTVSFYAVDTLETDRLINNLRTFSESMPKDIIQSGKYLEGARN